MVLKKFGEYVTESVNLNNRLFVAAHEGDTDKVRELLDMGADKEAVSEVLGETPLIWCCANGHAETAELLLNSGANREARNSDGMTSLIIASMKGYTEIVKLLLEYGADKEAKNNGGWTPLIWASINGKTETVKLLLEYGADIESKNDDSNTPLVYASKHGRNNIVKLLLEYGADIKNNGNDNIICLDFPCYGVWKEEYTQELIISGQPQNIKFFDDKIGILHSLKLKYKEVIEMSELGIFG